MMFYYMFINICSVVSYLLQRYNFFETNKIFCTTFNMLFILNFGSMLNRMGNGKIRLH